MPSPARLLLFLASGSLVHLGLTASWAWCAWPHDPSVNLRLGSSILGTYTPAVADGEGGFIVFWTDDRLGNYDIFAKRITATGALAPGWPATGLAVCTAAGIQVPNVAPVSDGAGGALLVWTDYRNGQTNGDIFAQRVLASGAIAPGWPENGRVLSVDARNEAAASAVSDGVGGIITAWQLSFSPTDIDIYGGRVNGAGVVSWSGSLVSPGFDQRFPALSPDGVQGAVMAYEDWTGGTPHITAVRIASTGGLVWGPQVLSEVGPSANSPVVAGDALGNTIIAWLDYRNGDSDIYGSRVSLGGALVPGWSPVGNSLVIDADQQSGLRIVADGSQGAVLTWTDTNPVPAYVDIQALRITGAGTPAPGWPSAALTVCSAPGLQTGPAIASDGSGGAFIVWYDSRFQGSYDIYMHRVTATGTLAPGWSADGTPVSIAIGDQTFPWLISDGRGGAIATWSDHRDGSSLAAFAQRVDRFGQLGDAAPAITNVSDVVADQGGHVKVTWTPSYVDADPQFGIFQYWVWRSVPAAAAEAAVAAGGRWLDSDVAAEAATMTPEALGALAQQGLYTTSWSGTASYAWEFLDALPASGFPQYSYVAATSTDSMPGSNPYTPFMVQARGVVFGTFWDSAPDSGYSVDNLAPATPTPFTGAYQSGTTTLSWGANGEADFVHYRLHRGSSAGFVPSPMNLIAQQSQAGFVDNPGVPSYYKLTAVDIHGNASPYALLEPSGTLDVPGGSRPTVLALSPPTPNPVHGEAAFRIALPEAGPVSLGIFDARGRLVRELAGHALEAGEHVLRWDGRDGRGHPAGSGLYLVRLQAGGRTLNTRFVALR